MKKTIVLYLLILILSNFTVCAFDIIDIKPDDSFVQSYGRDVNADISYLRAIAYNYRNKYIVTEEPYIDCVSIDTFYNNLLQGITLLELDSGKTNFSTEGIYMDSDYRNQLNQLKVLGGLSGYKANFEPIAFFHIHRDIALIGGYVNYKKTYKNPDDAYWQYISNVEFMTKEVIPYETRLKLLDRVRDLNKFIDNDRSFKIFLLVDGRIDGLYLKD